ncbi:hypothetical protein [Nakamurella endophytica]|uniref:DUF4258 domain-containing protein n=1 Tax=Nakamurella endophytica TaxID=1748367 RepID=A0A917WMB4_9ACTN|nr:hypothetical protein [Nakamurella endophytica]GGM16102.1 hypothetical protein GCM10011594_40140 [Nakamurella endophytica]
MPVHESAQPVYSKHAVGRMRDLRIPRAEVESVLQRPLMTLPGGFGHESGRTVFVGAVIRVVVGDDDGVVITVGLRTSTPYVHGVHHRYNLPTAA